MKVIFHHRFYEVYTAEPQRRAAGDVPREHAAPFAWIPGVAWSDRRSLWRQYMQNVIAKILLSQRHHLRDP